MKIMVGASCVNAVSSQFVVTVKTGGEVYETKFEKGLVTEHTHKIGKCSKEESGTAVSYVLDDEIWEEEQRFENPHRHYLDMTPAYYELKMELLSKTREEHA